MRLLFLLPSPAIFLGFTVLGKICAYVTIFNPTIEVATFRLREWCMLGVFLLPAFTCLQRECQDLLSSPAIFLGFTILGEICAYVTISNPTIEVATFRLRGWCMLGVFLLPAFTYLRHKCQDLLSSPAIFLGFTILGEICAYVTISNPTIEIATFRLCGWCMLGCVFVASIHLSTT